MGFEQLPFDREQARSVSSLASIVVCTEAKESERINGLAKFCYQSIYQQALFTYAYILWCYGVMVYDKRIVHAFKKKKKEEKKMELQINKVFLI